MRSRLDRDLLRSNAAELFFERCSHRRHTPLAEPFPRGINTEHLREPISQIDPYRCHIIPIDFHLPTSCFGRLLHGQSPFCASSTLTFAAHIVRLRRRLAFSSHLARRRPRRRMGGSRGSWLPAKFE